MSTIMFKCPSCGGYLEFEPQHQRFRCLYCGQGFSEEELQEQSGQREAEAEERAAEAPQAPGMKGYHCQMCGAEIITEETTAATRCYYCHSPVVLQDRLNDDFRPDGVVPFALDKEAAKAKFMEYIRRKRFVDRRFFDEGQLEMFSGVYYPYWYFDVQGEANFQGQGVNRSVHTSPRYVTTVSRYYAVKRRADMRFRDVARKALGKLDGKLSDGIHPYDPAGVKPYAAGYLSGFLAEMRDTEADSVAPGVMQEVQGYADQLVRRGHTWHSLTGETAFSAQQVEKRYVLLPVWVLTWKGEAGGKPYYYLMNGQTGNVCGRLPIDWKKVALWAAGLGALVAGLLLAGGKFLW